MSTRACKDCGVSKAISNFARTGEICFECKILRAERAEERRKEWRKKYEKSPKGKEAIRRANIRHARARRAAKGYPETAHPVGYYASRRLTAEQVRKLRAEYRPGDGKIWAARLGLTQPSIWGIVNYKTYKEVV